MIKLFQPFMPPEVDAPLLETLHSGMITQGQKVEEFEKKLGEVIDNPLVLSVNSGTSALTLALRLANIGPGDEVISTPMTCAATNLPIMVFGAKIVWADIDPLTGLISTKSIISRITDRTKVILTVDWGGAPVDYQTIRMVADARGITFISDAAHSLGASYKGFPIGHGSLAHMTCFSFQAIKTITTIDGGAISFSNEWVYKRGKILRWFGVDRENNTKFRGELDIPEYGYKFHMNDVNATIGIVQLDFLKGAIERQSEYSFMYLNQLNSNYVRVFNLDGVSANWLYIVLLENEEVREKFRIYMSEHDIEVSQVHWRNDRLSAFQGFQWTFGARHLDDRSGLNEYSKRMIAIPIHHQLTKEQIQYVIDTMNAFEP